MAGKDNLQPSEIDKTSFFYTGLCSICHPGGGWGEYDRDGQLLYNADTGQFGYELLGKSSAQVAHDGDYSVLNHQNGDIKLAPWDVTGLLEPDCLMCHRTQWTINGEKNMNWIWRAGTQRAREALVDDQGVSAPAFASAPAAGMGWANVTLKAGVSPPQASDVTIDYSKGMANGSVLESAGEYRVAGNQITKSPKDYACWGCHVTPDLKKRGRIWFDATKDVHYAGVNHLNPDDDPADAIAATESKVCTYCHTAGMTHSIAKGNANLGSVENETDYKDLRTCVDCHDQSVGNPLRDAAATAMPPEDDEIHTSRHLRLLSCQSCHIPYKEGAADFVVDNATTGKTIGYKSNEFLSADPLNPADPDKSRWFPTLRMKQDKDGLMKLFPHKRLLSVWWGTWDQGGTPGLAALGDDVVHPIALWRVRGLTGGQPLPGTTDDNGDTKPEVNRPDEIMAYITALKGVDKYGVQLAANPVLVKGGAIWYEDPANPGQVLHLEYHDTGMKVESSHAFSIDHNVRDKSMAWGALRKCTDCHFSRQTPVFDRKILVDPFDSDSAASPVYKTVRELTGVSPY